jgi:flavin-dependent dehydrogenase
MPTMSEFYRLMTNNCGEIRVGNAAGLVNSLLGGGEHLAVISGILAGELVAKGKEDNYYQALMEIVSDEMRIGISAYELIKKLDIQSVSKLIEMKLTEQLDYINLNKGLRKTIKKWITIEEVTNNDLEKFVEN